MDIASFINNKMLDAEIKQESKLPKRRTVRERDISEMPQTANCGNCQFISYHGINEVKLEVGDCEQYKNSGRYCTKPHFEPCAFWQMRSRTKMVNERAFAREMRNTILSLNARQYGIRGYEDPEESLNKKKRTVNVDGTDISNKPKKAPKKEKISGKEALQMLGIFSPGDSYIEDDDTADDNEDDAE